MSTSAAPPGWCGARCATASIHWGCVNTRERCRYVASVGGHSFDGSSFARWRRTHLDRGLAWTLEPPPVPGERADWQLPLAF